MSTIVDLMITFAKIGALTFGGGYSMLPILQREVVEKKKWVTEEEVMDYYAVGQCLPGMIAINTATFVGRKVGGNKGGIVAAVATAFPSLIVIMIIAAFMHNFSEIRAIQNAFYGIRIAVAALIVDAIIKLWKKSMKDVFCYVLYAVALLLSILTELSTVILVVVAIAGGIAIQMIRRKNVK